MFAMFYVQFAVAEIVLNNELGVQISILEGSILVLVVLLEETIYKFMWTFMTLHEILHCTCC